LDYWKTQLAGAPALLELPTDYPRPASQSSNGARHPVRFSPSLVGRLKAVSQRENCTLFMTILAGFQALLARYSGRDDMVVGTVVANRNRPELERLIGFFANTLVLRTDLSGDPTFRQVLERTRSVTLDAYAHQDLPFEKLVEELHPVRDRSYHPIFQVMLVLQNVPATSQNGALKIDKTEIDPGTALFDLTLNLTETGDSIAGYLQYSTDLFESETISRMINHLQLLLENAVSDPERRLSQLRMLSEEERQQLVVGWNATASEYPKELTWVQLFERQVARSPQATALVFGQQRLSYEQLNGRANQLARHLRKLGVGPESLVGICAERSLELVVGILGVLKAGGAYLPMDPVYPAERLAFMLEDAQVKVLLSQEKIQRPWPENARVIQLDKLELNDESAENPPPLSHPENLAYVIYTSGSTGKPKGVALEHRSLNAFAHWAKELYRPEELEGVLAGTSICFDLSVYELLVPLCWGGKIILATNVLQLPELPAASEVRLINTVPSAATELVRLKAIPSTVQVINLAGEPLRQSLVDQLYGLGTLKKVYDLYGPTEDTVYSTCALRTAQGRETIGRPLANKEIYILDEQMEPVPVGVVGQLYIGGDGLARGYLQRPELTEQRFIQSQWGRLYKTGDLARYRVEGNIEFIGRADHQVKIRGFRIELGEVETQLRQHPQVREAVVIALEEGGEKRLVGYVVAAEGVTVNELKDHLRRCLPDYMVPSAVVLLEKLPLTPNGKVDRKALPLPSQTTAATSADFAAPRTQTERILAEIWCKLLNLSQVGIHDNYFRLGGHSLLAIRVVSRMREAFQIDLPMSSIFEAPTVAELAQMVERQLVAEIEQLSESEAATLVGK
jgi:amino acid adenylation domain-containing protein